MNSQVSHQVMAYVPGTLPKILTRCDEAIDFSSPEIAVHVGQPPKIFHVHEALVRGCSPFFDTAMQPKWQGNSRVVLLADDDIAAFNIYMNWLYRGKICFYMATCSKDSEEIDEAWVGAFNAYALGDKLLDNHFKNALTDAVARSSLHIPSPSALHILYDNTMPGSPLRRLLVHAIAKQENHIACVQESWPYALVIDLVKYLQFNRQDLILSVHALANRCEFHEHVENDYGDGCYRNRSPLLGSLALSFSSLQAPIDFTTGTIRFSIGNDAGPTIFSVNDRLLRRCQPSLDFEVKSKEAGIWTLVAKASHSSFNIYLNWLCTGKMCIDYDMDDIDGYKIWTEIAGAYGLGQRLDDTSFADAITDAVALMLGQGSLASAAPLPADDDILDAMDDVLDCYSYSRLWHLLAHRFASLQDVHDVIMPSWPSGFTFGIAEELGKRLYDDEMSTRAAAIDCKFHAHLKKEECYRLRWPGSL